MQLFGIGPLEFLLIAVIAVIVLGPQGMVKGAREAGRFIRKLTRSSFWRDVVDTSNEIRDLPRKIVQEAGIEEDIKELQRSTQMQLNEAEHTHLPPGMQARGEIKAVNAEETMKDKPGEGSHESGELRG